jgi:hypothetical protein
MAEAAKLNEGMGAAIIDINMGCPVKKVVNGHAGSALMLVITMAAAIGSYTVNLRVSAERSVVEKLQRQLVADAREIRTLQVELRTRARFPEMQRWNDGVFQMSAPAAGQYLRNPVQLASFGAAPEAAAAPSVTYAVTTSAAVPTAPAGPVTVAYAPRPAAPSATVVAAPDAARLIRAGYTQTKAASAPVPVAVPAPAPVVTPGPVEILPEGRQ